MLPAPHVNFFLRFVVGGSLLPGSPGGPGAWELVQCGGVCSFGPAKGVPPALCRLLGSCPSFGSLGGTTRPRPVEVIVDIPPSPSYLPPPPWVARLASLHLFVDDITVIL